MKSIMRYWAPIAVFVLLLCNTLQATASGNDGKKPAEGDTVRVNISGVFPEIFDEDSMQADMQVPAEQELWVEGAIQRIEGNAFRYIIVAGADGQEYKMLWLYDFDGAERLNHSKNRWQGKTVRINYQTLNCYMPKEGVYVRVPQVKALKFVQR